MLKLNVVAYWHDGGDGGGSTVIYNNLDELREDQFKPGKWTSKEDCEKRFQSALSGESPYEDGEISNTTIEIESNADGSLRLAKSVHLHYGQ